MSGSSKKPGFYLARFFENAAPFSETKGGLTVSGYEYDEYQMELADTGNLQDDVLNNFDAMLTQAKAAEVGDDPGGLETRVSTLEGDKADKAEVQAVWDSMAIAYSEGVQKA